MLSKEQNERLTRVGPGTPMGELLRRYWYPVAFTRELDEWPIRKVRLLGEDFALWKTPQGRLRHRPGGLPAPGGIPDLRRGRGGRSPVRLPRVEVRLLRQLHRAACGAGQDRLHAPRQGIRGQGTGPGRDGVGLHRSRTGSRNCPASTCSWIPDSSTWVTRCCPAVGSRSWRTRSIPTMSSGSTAATSSSWGHSRASWRPSPSRRST